MRIALCENDDVMFALSNQVQTNKAVWNAKVGKHKTKLGCCLRFVSSSSFTWALLITNSFTENGCLPVKFLYLINWRYFYREIAWVVKLKYGASAKWNSILMHQHTRHRPQRFMASASFIEPSEGEATNREHFLIAFYCAKVFEKGKGLKSTRSEESSKVNRLGRLRSKHFVAPRCSTQRFIQ